MTAVMQGVRILEVAEHTFVPAASALLADWGAEVIKIEHVERGDAMRGLASSGVGVMGADVHVLLEHSNRGKKSLGLDLTTDGGPRHPLQARRHLRRLPHQQAAERPHQAEDRRRRHPGRTTRTSSTCGAPARASAAPTPTRAPTTRSPTGAAPASPWASSSADDDHVPAAAGARVRRLDRRDDDRRRDHGRALPPRAHRRGHRRSTSRCSASACGRWARRWRCRSSSSMPWAPPPPDGPTRATRSSPPTTTKDGRFVSLSASRPASTGPRRATVDRPAGAGHRRALRRRRSPHGQRRRRRRARWPQAFAERTADEWRERARPTSPASGRWCRTRSRRRRPADRRQRLRQRLRDRRRHAVPAGRRPGAVRRRAAAPQAGARVQRARRRDPRDARPRLDAIVDLKVRGVVA